MHPTAPLLHTTRTHTFTVLPGDVADFTAEGGGLVHPVCSTYRLARAAEWAGRLFVLELKEVGEEGVGTHVHLNHHAPAFPGEKVVVTATLTQAAAPPDGTLTCSFVAHVGARLVASGTTGQRILPLTKLAVAFARP